jgi:hypothetical protein
MHQNIRHFSRSMIWKEFIFLSNRKNWNPNWIDQPKCFHLFRLSFSGVLNFAKLDRLFYQRLKKIKRKKILYNFEGHWKKPILNYLGHFFVKIYIRSVTHTVESSAKGAGFIKKMYSCSFNITCVFSIITLQSLEFWG